MHFEKARSRIRCLAWSRMPNRLSTALLGAALLIGCNWTHDTASSSNKNLMGYVSVGRVQRAPQSRAHPPPLVVPIEPEHITPSQPENVVLVP